MKIFLVLIIAVILYTPILVFSGQYPDKPVRVIIAYPPGGGTDIVGRYVLSVTAERTNKIIMFDYAPGATGVIGTRKASQADADGYTLLMGHISPNSINPGDFQSPRVPVDWKLTSICRIAISPSLLLARPNTNIKTFNDFKKWSDNTHIMYGSDGIGSLAHLQMVNLLGNKEKMATHVPYKGGAAALQGMFTGDIPVMFSPLPVAIEHISSGRFIAIAQTGDKRSSLLPDLPTLAEQGESKFVGVLWWGLFSPTGVPEHVKKYWENELYVTLSQPKVIEWLINHGYTPAFLSSTDFDRYVRSENEKWSSIIKLISVNK